MPLADSVSISSPPRPNKDPALQSQHALAISRSGQATLIFLPSVVGAPLADIDPLHRRWQEIQHRG
jgi:hypothetical protein